VRIIKLSSMDIDFPDRPSVDEYFNVKLHNRNPVGQFLFTQGRIAEGGISTNEPIIFSYKKEITHIAKAASGRIVNTGEDAGIYPFYFIVDISTICLAQGNLADVEDALVSAEIYKNIVHTQGWPLIPDSLEVNQIWKDLKRKDRNSGDVSQVTDHQT